MKLLSYHGLVAVLFVAALVVGSTTAADSAAAATEPDETPAAAAAAAMLRRNDENDENDEQARRSLLLLGGFGDFRLTNFRCGNETRCSNDPGLVDGNTMHAFTELRQLKTCIQVCVPTRYCWDAVGLCTPNIFLMLAIKNLLGWNCGPCPTEDEAE